MLAASRRLAAARRALPVAVGAALAPRSPRVASPPRILLSTRLPFSSSSAARSLARGASSSSASSAAPAAPAPAPPVASVSDFARFLPAPAFVSRTTATRVESDLLGSLELPADALYGIATARAMRNYQISGVQMKDFPELIVALALVKRACATANGALGLLPSRVERAIVRACDALIASNEHHGQFAVDVIQGGAGTSANMAANEVIANLAAGYIREEEERRGGDGTAGLDNYALVHPNDHVNLCQSTNCAYPSAAKLAVVIKHGATVRALRDVIAALRAKGDAFSGVVKMGRTQLQDAVPMTLGQEFHAFASSLDADATFMARNVDQLYELNVGGTAIGTKICADPRFSAEAVAALAELTGLPLRSPTDFVEASSSTGAFLLFSNILRRVAVKTSKMCNDLRLLSSGPRCGFGEIALPPAAPGSSIMPGKINPVIPEVVNQVCFQVMGADATIAAASEAGQLQLNVFEPVIVFNLLNVLGLMTNALETLRTRCVEGIEANERRCAELVRGSIGVVTNLLPVLGYKDASAVAAEALRTGRPVADIAVEMGADPEDVAAMLDPRAMTGGATSDDAMSAREGGRGVCLDTPGSRRGGTRRKIG
jgi:aspartate ammonia-lyase